MDDTTQLSGWRDDWTTSNVDQLRSFLFHSRQATRNLSARARMEFKRLERQFERLKRDSFSDDDVKRAEAVAAALLEEENRLRVTAKTTTTSAVNKKKNKLLKEQADKRAQKLRAERLDDRARQKRREEQAAKERVQAVIEEVRAAESYVDFEEAEQRDAERLRAREEQERVWAQNQVAAKEEKPAEPKTPEVKDEPESVVASVMRYIGFDF